MRFFPSLSSFARGLLPHAGFLLVCCSAETSRDEGSLGHLSAAYVSGSGSNTNQAPSLLRVGPDVEQNPRELDSAPGATNSVAFDGTNYLVVWKDPGVSQAERVFANRLTQQGELLDENPLEVAIDDARQEAAVAASDGTGFLVLYAKSVGLNATSHELRLTRITADGKVLDPGGVHLADCNGYARTLALASNGKSYLATWTELVDPASTKQQVLRGAIVTNDASIQIGATFDIAAVGRPISTISWFKHASASNGNDYLAVWEDKTQLPNEKGYDLVVSRISDDGRLLPSAANEVTSRLTLNAHSDDSVSVASDGSEYLILSTDAVATTPGTSRRQIIATRVDSRGAFALESPITLSPSEDNQYSPLASFDGTRYLATWQSRNTTNQVQQFTYSYVNPESKLSPTPGVPLLNGSIPGPLLAPRFSGLPLLTWSANIFTGFASSFAALLDPNLGATQTRKVTRVSLKPRSEYLRNVACTKNNCLALWSEEHYDLEENSLSPGVVREPLLTGLLEDNGELRTTTLTTLKNSPSAEYYSATLASNDSGYLVAWWEQSGPNYATRIYIRAFDANGQPLTQTPTLVDEFTAFPGILGLASTGEGYLLTYVKYNDK